VPFHEGAGAVFVALGYRINDEPVVLEASVELIGGVVLERPGHQGRESEVFGDVEEPGGGSRFKDEQVKFVVELGDLGPVAVCFVGGNVVHAVAQPVQFLELGV
jgi:hypothetical protein